MANYALLGSRMAAVSLGFELDLPMIGVTAFVLCNSGAPCASFSFQTEVVFTQKCLLSAVDHPKPSYILGDSCIGLAIVILIKESEKLRLDGGTDSDSGKDQCHGNCQNFEIPSFPSFK